MSGFRRVGSAITRLSDQIGGGGAPFNPYLALGTAVQGGYYAGAINYPDGSYYALIVAPAVGGMPSGTLMGGGNSGTNYGIAGANGKANTDFLASHPDSFPAADWCAALDLAGYDDWYLPSLGELTLIKTNAGSLPAPAQFAAGTYNTSSYEWSGTVARWSQDIFPSGGTVPNMPGASVLVRAIRHALIYKPE